MDTWCNIADHGPRRIYYGRSCYNRSSSLVAINIFFPGGYSPWPRQCRTRGHVFLRQRQTGRVFGNCQPGPALFELSGFQDGTRNLSLHVRGWGQVSKIRSCINESAFSPVLITALSPAAKSGALPGRDNKMKGFRTRQTAQMDSFFRIKKCEVTLATQQPL